MFKVFQLQMWQYKFGEPYVHPPLKLPIGGIDEEAWPWQTPC